MTELTSVVRILNGFLRVVIDAELKPAERQEVAEAIRSGHLVNCLLGVLEFDNAQRTEARAPAPMPSPVEASVKKEPKGKSAILTPDEMFNLVRKRKISKIALSEIVERLNSGAALGTSSEASMREIIEVFRHVASDAEWITLARAVAGEIENDSYLSRILGR